MFVYVVLEALVGIVVGIVLAAHTKKVEGVTYGKLDKAGRTTNILLTILYGCLSPVYLFFCMISSPRYEGLLDILVIAPATGNTIAKLAAGITDGAVTMAAKAHLRNGRPVVIALASNDGLSAGARNIGELLVRKNYYFVPFGQDSALLKPCSLVADFDLLPETVAAALCGEQLQPILLRS